MSSARNLRIACIGLTATTAAACYTGLHFFGWHGITTRPLALVGFVFTGATLAVSLILTCQSTARLDRLGRWLLTLCEPPQTELQQSSRLPKLTVALATIAFLVITSTFLSILTNQSDSDPAAFLRFSGEVEQAGGPLNLLKELYTGEYIQANQHPFYIGLMSLSPTLDFGKALSFFAGLITFLAVTLHLVKTRGWQTAGLGATLIATNYAFCYFSGLATCEAWLTLWITWVWILLDRSALARTLTHSRKLWFGLGFLMGLAYLTKGTAHVFLGALCLAGMTAYYQRRPDDSRIKKLQAATGTLLVILCGWIIACHPLLIRNSIVYQSPTFNVNTYFLYMDNFPDEPAIQAKLAASHSLPEVFRTFLDNHTTTELLQREIQGIGWESFIFVRSLGPSPIDDSRVLVALPILLLTLLMLLHIPRSLQVYIVSLIIVSILIFGWYIPIAAGQRFTAPMIPMLMGYAAIGLNNTVENSPRLKSSVISLLAIAWAIIWSVWTVLLLA